MFENWHKIKINEYLIFNFKKGIIITLKKSYLMNLIIRFNISMHRNINIITKLFSNISGID